MDISIIIPTFKPGKYIYKCLLSIVQQTFDKNRFELILILNGPQKEPYYNEIDSFLGDKGIIYKLIYTSLPGVSNARNCGLDNATGEYITFVDDDDYISENYLEELYNKANRNVISLARPIAFNDITGLISKKYPIEMEFYRCKDKKIQVFYKAKKFFSGPWMKLIHKDVIGNRRFNIAFKNGEDSLFMFLISDRMKYVDFTSETAIYYRRNRANSAVSNNKNFKYRLINSIRMINEYNKYYCSNIYGYNFYFFFTRILGAIKSVLLIR